MDNKERGEKDEKRRGKRKVALTLRGFNDELMRFN